MVEVIAAVGGALMTACFVSVGSISYRGRQSRDDLVRNTTAIELLTTKIDDLHKLAKALLTYETLTGEEIENLINKNIYPSNKEELKEDDKKQDSALDEFYKIRPHRRIEDSDLDRIYGPDRRMD